MTDIIHIMLDLETWGTTPGSDLRSIGACVFDPMTGEVGDRGIVWGSEASVFYIATDNPGLTEDEAVTLLPDGDRALNAEYPHFDGVDHFRRFKLTRDPKTVQWWSEQSAEAQAAFADPVRLDEALDAFSCWVADVCDGHFLNVRIWSHGANFDPGIIAAAYRACGLPDPIHYRAPRDTRTIFEAAGMDPKDCLEAFKGDGVYHHALDDAITQARAVCEAFRRLREPVTYLQRIADLGSCAGRGGLQKAIDLAVEGICKVDRT